MGIPSFFSWLVAKYPNIVSPKIDTWREEDRDEDKEEDDQEEDEEEEDKEGKEDDDDEEEDDDDGFYDNLYLDMNEIIYKCFRLNNGLVYHWFFDYLDRLFRIVRPRRLLYLAVDGVAPMAKLNKLRQAYFKSAKLARDAEAEAILLTEIFRVQGKEVLPRDAYEIDDHTVKMPGPDVMARPGGGRQDRSIAGAEVILAGFAAAVVAVIFLYVRVTRKSSNHGAEMAEKA